MGLSQSLTLYNSYIFPNVNAQNQKDKTYLAVIADIGGTNIRFQLIAFSNFSEQYDIKDEQKLETKNFKSFQQCLTDFLKERKPQIACFGMAGPVFDNVCELTNAPWDQQNKVIDGKEISKQFNIPKVQLYNDFDVLSYGILKIKDTELVKINNVEKIPNKIMAVCGPGTGLGVSMLVPFKQSDSQYDYQVWPSEGGHVSFPQTSEQLQNFYNFLKQQDKYKKFGDQIALEYGLAGPAIPYMYYFCKKYNQHLEPVLEKEMGSDKFNNPDDFPSKEVFQYGAQRRDKLCQRVVDLFLEIYVITMENIAISTLCYSGLYLCQGITNGILDYILEQKDSLFKDYIKSRLYLKKDVFDKIPIYVVKNLDLGLLGAFNYAQKIAQTSNI